MTPPKRFLKFWDSFLDWYELPPAELAKVKEELNHVKAQNYYESQGRDLNHCVFFYEHDDTGEIMAAIQIGENDFQSWPGWNWHDKMLARNQDERIAAYAEWRKKK